MHPPYTLWHLGYVVIGSTLAPRPHLFTLVLSIAAFFLAVGIGAHCLDELHGRPLGTSLPRWALVSAGATSLVGAAAIGAIGVKDIGWVLVPFIAVGVLLVAGYNLELAGRTLHNDTVFCLAWGSFPVLTAYAAQTGTLRPAPVLAAVAAYFLAVAQRTLSTRARLVRRNATGIEGSMRMSTGLVRCVDEAFLIEPLEIALRAMSWAVVALAIALALDRMG